MILKTSFYNKLLNQYLANRFAAVIGPLDYWSWIGVIISLIVFTIVTLIMISVYENVCPSKSVPHLSKTKVVLRLLIGITEPEPCKFDAPASFRVGKKSEVLK